MSWVENVSLDVDHLFGYAAVNYFDPFFSALTSQIGCRDIHLCSFHEEYQCLPKDL